ncbi:MAG: serine hydrolase, partial [Gammaproteobacteria bacterium]|nr:serine hydrolase [Gammaproteobacteria bacterium]MCY4322405.1 serine hydrolase [Gammaproteobacteria bacterium]
MTVIKGTCDARFDAVRDKFAQNIASGEDLGASFAVSIDGEMVIDIWGGHLDEERRAPWQKDTIVNVYSSTKTMSFLCALVLGSRG